MTPFFNANTVRMDSTAPTAPTEWPSADLRIDRGLVTAQCIVDRDSATSPTDVPVARVDVVDVGG